MNGSGGGEGSSGVDHFKAKLGRTYQYWLDKSTPHIQGRWLALAAILVMYGVRVYMVNGWFIVTYGLGIFLLNNLIGFMSPQFDPENEGPTLPTAGDEEFRPFSRRLPEFQFWLVSFKSIVAALGMTFFEIFNVPVFWPILLVYFIVLFTITMKRQIKHMVKHKYVPWSWGKKKYSGGGGGGGL